MTIPPWLLWILVGCAAGSGVLASTTAVRAIKTAQRVAQALHEHVTRLQSDDPFTLTERQVIARVARGEAKDWMTEAGPAWLRPLARDVVQSAYLDLLLRQHNPAREGIEKEASRPPTTETETSA